MGRGDWGYGDGRDRRADSRGRREAPRDRRGGGAYGANGHRGDSRRRSPRRVTNGARQDSRARGRRDESRRRNSRSRDRRDFKKRQEPQRDRSRSARRWSPKGDARRRPGGDGGRSPAARDAQQSHRGGNEQTSYRGAPPAKAQKPSGRDEKPRSASGGSQSSGYSSSGSSDDDDGKKKKSGGGDTDKDEIIHFSWEKGMVMNSRYCLTRLAGDGTFGRVVLAKDKEIGREVAIKIIRDVKRYIENAKIEADILKDIRKADPQGTRSRSAIMYDTFMHDSKYFCLVLEPLGVSLYDFLKKNAFRGFWMQDIQNFAKQALEALNFLHTELQMTHTDLKPENILIETLEPARPGTFPREAEWLQQRRSTRERGTEYLRPAHPNIKLIDFGNATYRDEHHSSIINTRQYRGPEVILSLGWDELSDIWSIGCILMELYTGELLFGTHENLEHLALMERILGAPLPAPMLESAPKSAREKYLTMGGAPGACGQHRLHWPEKATSASSEKHVRTAVKLGALAKDTHVSFSEFVGYLLTTNPKNRPTAHKALSNSFFSKSFND